MPDRSKTCWVQVVVLDVLDQEGALHLLPSMQRAPSFTHDRVGQGLAQNLYVGAKPPAEVVRMYRRLLDNGSLKRASELGSLPHGMATKWV